MSTDPERAFFLSQRDKHLAQFMDINAKAVFTVLGLVVSVLLGIGNVESVPDAGTRHAVVALLGAGAVLLVIAAIMMSRFHTGQIRRFEQLCVKDDEKETGTVTRYQVIPPSPLANYLAATGILSLIGAVLILVTTHLAR